MVLGPMARADVRYIAEGHLFAITGVNHQVADAFCLVAFGIVHTDGEIECLSLFVHLRYGFPCQAYADIFGELGKGNAIACQHLAARFDDQLWAFYLLLYVEVGHAGNVADGITYFASQAEHAIEVIAEELDGNVGLCTAQHGVDAVADGLSYLDDGTGDTVQLLAHFGGEFAPASAFQFKGGFQFADVHAQGMLVQFGASCLARHGLYFRDGHQQFFGTLPDAVTLFERNAGQGRHIDGERPLR